MASSVHFKFKSQKDPTRVTFDGTGISVFELKREIITIHKLGDGTDFELAIYNESTNEGYEDDTTIIPRSTSVIAKRLPARQPGKGGAARYVTGKAPVKAKTQSKHDVTTSKSKSNAATDMMNAQTEEERMAAFLNLKDEQWKEKQQEMANQKPVYYNKGGKRANVPEGEPPHGYVCYRCGKKGHWIQACPTNDDPTFEGHFRIKRTLGIPKTFLTKIEKPDFLDGSTDISKMQGVMVNSDGDFVIAHTDEKTWKQFQEKEKASKAAEKAAAVVDNKELQDRGLECPIDKKLFVDPMKTPCCGKTYCENCITNALIDNDLICPGCHSENVLIDNLVEDKEAVQRMKVWEDDKARQKSEREASNSPVASNAPTPAPNGVGSPGMEQRSRPSSSEGNNSKKRTADEALAQDLSPASHMKRQRSNDTPTASSTQKLRDSNATPQSKPPDSNVTTDSSMPPDLNAMVAAGMFPPNMDPSKMNGFSSMPFMPPMPGGMPDMSSGNNMGMNMQNMPDFSNMPNMQNMPMPMPFGMMNPMMMNQSFNSIPNGGSSSWNSMPNFSNMSQSNGTGPNNNFQGPGNTQNGPRQHNSFRHNNNFIRNNFGNQNTPQSNNYNNQNRFPSGKQPPAGPAAMQNPNPNSTQNKFSNQQRYMGKEEDQAYFRQPVNPARAFNRGRQRVRPSDFKEL
ncbi:MAG: hypothetical protein Q9227_008488 [Pyrenula ochraceoflavens]